MTDIPEQSASPESPQEVRDVIDSLLAGGVIDTSTMSEEDYKRHLEALKTALAGKSFGELCAGFELPPDAQKSLSFMREYRPNGVINAYFNGTGVGDWISKNLAYPELQRRSNHLVDNLSIYGPPEELAEEIKSCDSNNPGEIITILNRAFNKYLEDADIVTSEQIIKMMEILLIHPRFSPRGLCVFLTHCFEICKSLQDDFLSQVKFWTNKAKNGGLLEVEVNDAKIGLVEGWLDSLQDSGRLWSEGDQAIVDVLGIDFSDHLSQGRREVAASSIVQSALKKRHPFSKQDYLDTLQRFGVSEEVITKEDMAPFFTAASKNIVDKLSHNPEIELGQLKMLSDVFGFSAEDIDADDIEAINIMLKKLLDTRDGDIEYVLSVVQWANEVGVELVASPETVRRIAYFKREWYEEAHRVRYNEGLVARIFEGMAQLNELERRFGVVEEVMTEEINFLKDDLRSIFEPRDSGAPLELAQWIMRDGAFGKLVRELNKMLVVRGISLERMKLNPSLTEKFRDLEKRIGKEADDICGEEAGKEAVQDELDRKLFALKEVKVLLGLVCD